MPKELKWVLLIALGVFIGIFAYDRYLTYQAQRAIQEFTDGMNSILHAESERAQKALKASNLRAQEIEQQRLANEASKKRKEFNRTTACGINEDAGTCKCINKETGARVTVPYEECTRRAREITW